VEPVAMEKLGSLLVGSWVFLKKESDYCPSSFTSAICLSPCLFPSRLPPAFKGTSPLFDKPWVLFFRK
jgi:hypothetical protein